MNGPVRLSEKGIAESLSSCDSIFSKSGYSICDTVPVPGILEEADDIGSKADDSVSGRASASSLTSYSENSSIEHSFNYSDNRSSSSNSQISDLAINPLNGLNYFLPNLDHSDDSPTRHENSQPAWSDNPNENGSENDHKGEKCVTYSTEKPSRTCILF